MISVQDFFLLYSGILPVEQEVYLGSESNVDSVLSFDCLFLVVAFHCIEQFIQNAHGLYTHVSPSIRRFIENDLQQKNK